MHLFLLKIVAFSCRTSYIYLMRTPQQCYKLLSCLSPGRVHTWHSLKPYSKSLGRNVKQLLGQGLLKKVGPGLYLSPENSRFGKLPPDDNALVSAFLKSDDFLLFPLSLYNSLGLGLTQLKNETVVYNKKRYEVVELSGRKFNFKRPNNGYPKKLTPEFLLVDFFNNIKSVGEPVDKLELQVKRKINSGKFDVPLLLKTANKYGKVGTKKFFNQFH